MQGCKPLSVNNKNTSQTLSNIRFGIILDQWLTFVEHFKLMLSKLSRTIEILGLQQILFYKGWPYLQ